MLALPLLEIAEEQLQLRSPAAALLSYEHAEAAGADPDRCAGGRWLCHMLLGDFTAAWRESDSIRARGAPDPHALWNGTPIAGKRLMLRSLHGFGDAVQFLRYAPLLRAQAVYITLEVAPRLVELASLFPGIDQVITWGEAAPVDPPQWDLQVEIMELPYLFRTTLPTLPARVPYLHLPAAALHAAQRDLAGSRPRIGVATQTGAWNPSRNLPCALLGDACRDIPATFVSLEGGPDGTPTRAPFPRVPGGCDGLLRTAAVIANLELVVTADTLAAHLAGALAKPVWLLLQHEADWRWMLDRSDSPWYPTMRIFRQPSPGDWASVGAQLRAALEHALRQWTADRLIG